MKSSYATHPTDSKGDARGVSVFSSAGIRERFLGFFEKRGHRRVASSPLVPGNDPTLLFTNSGMVQFKDVFLGFDKRPYDRAVTAQRCLRAGGKHNDLENVGYTARHHTFFEMLGNFSFGQYFKEKAVPYAWEFLTGEEGLQIPREHLWVTVFGGGHLFGKDAPPVPADEQAAELWAQTLVGAGFSAREAEARIVRIPTADNFWMMGETGPCGPCSEIFYNRNPKAERFEGEDPERADDCVEVWNLVFMQFNRDDAGVLHPLPAPCVDTGMGLERVSAVMQNVRSNFETDAFAGLNAEVNRVCVEAGGRDCDGKYGSAHYVIADHARAAVFLVADGVQPSNEGRGYVLRRIIRRALRYGRKIGAQKPFFCKLVSPVCASVGSAHPVSPESQAQIAATLQREEEQFSRTLNQGLHVLKRVIVEHLDAEGPNMERLDDNPKFPGIMAFELYDTYGFPVDMTADAAREYGMEVDMVGFEECMSKHRARSRAATKFKMGQQTVEYDGMPTEFVGYRWAGTHILSDTAKVVAIYVDGKPAEKTTVGEEAIIVLSRTPFYAESGGQVGDTGVLVGADYSVLAVVSDTQKIRADVWGHKVKMQKRTIRVDDVVSCDVDAERRANIARAHSATHLMHSALRKVLGEHVAQRGSLVEAGRLRFDFSHTAAVSVEELREVERIVNEQVRRNEEVKTETLPYDDAVARGAMALFGEKYGDIVRMVTIGADYSVELCGGTHVSRAGDIGFFRFVGESAIAAGIRRVEAVAGVNAVLFSQEEHHALLSASILLKSPPGKVAEKISQLQEERKNAERELEKLRAAQTGALAAELAAKAERMGEVSVLAEKVAGAEGKGLRELAAELRGRLESPCAIFLAGGGAMAALVDADLVGEKWDAREWVRVAASAAGAKGGGRADFAQAGGADSARLDAAVEVAREWARERG